jgi:hypothetical protein
MVTILVCMDLTKSAPIIDIYLQLWTSQYSTVENSSLYSSVHYCTVLQCIVLTYTLLFFTVLYFTVLSKLVKKTYVIGSDLDYFSTPIDVRCLCLVSERAGSSKWK